MRKHAYMVKDALCFEHSVLLRKEIISLLTILNVLKLSQLQNSIKSSRVHTGCFTTSGHNCRRWFPRSLWWKKFI